MSASQEKKKRKNQPGPELSGKHEEKKSGRGAWIAGGICVAVLFVLAIFFAMVGSGFFNNHTTAAVAGSHKLSPAMYNYFFQDTYYQTYASYMTDPNTPLSEQYYDEASGVTWADYLTEQTNASIAQVYGIIDAAEEAGYTLSEEDIAAIDSQISSVALSAASNGVSTDAYLSNAYGQGSTEDNFREYMELRQLASAYQTVYSESLTYTDEEISAYYDEHKDELDTYSYRTFLCSVDSGETDEDGNPVVDGAASKEMADTMVEEAKGDEDLFVELSYENADEDSKSYYEDPDSSLISNATLSNISESLQDWISDASRQYGDTTAVENEDGSWTVAMFVENSDKYKDMNVVDVRHILIQPSDTEDETAIETAKATAQDILDQYLAGEQTEDAFAQLAVENSADSNAADGGLYENVYPGQMVSAFNDWCFDPDRQPGDTGIVETSYGFHVMYFVGEGDGGNAMDYRTQLAMRNNDTSDWITQRAETITVETKSFGMMFTSIK